jgi:hypothetical protein
MVTISSCVPSLTEESDSPSCSGGQSFNSRTRACVGASVSDGAPSPKSTFFSMSEDQDYYASLTYSDIGNDLLRECEAYSTNSGLVRKLTHEGVVITSDSDEDDADNILVKFVNNGSPAVSVLESTKTYITVGFTANATTSASLAALINGDGDDDCSDGDASCHVSATITEFKAVSNTLDYTSIDRLPCDCTGGSCAVHLTPSDDWYGNTDFYYRLRDDDGTSPWTLARVEIAGVNDAPTITMGAGTLSVTEDVAAAGVLATDAGFTVEDTSDGDPTGSNLTYEVVTTTSNGSLYLSGSGLYSYVTTANSTAADSFTFRVCDPNLACSAAETITISVTAAADAPYGTTASITAFDEGERANEPTDDQVDLEYIEPDGSGTVISCAITSTSGVFISTACTCVAGDCTVGITGKGHSNGIGSFAYTVTSDETPTTSSAKTVNFLMNAIADAPFGYGIVTSATSYEDNVGTSAIDTDTIIGTEGNLEFNESSTHLPNYVDFTIKTAYDPDGDTSLTYSIVTAPTNGTLTGCMDATGSSGNTDLSCTYTPANGNLNNSTTLTNTTTHLGFITVGADIRFMANQYGDTSNGISVEIIHAEGVGGGNEEAWVDGDTVKILYESGVSTATDLETLVNTNANVRVKSLISATDLTGNVLAGINGTYTLSTGTATADSFVYRVTDSTGATFDRTFHISIQPVEDNPIICEYSSYADTTVCGLNGCIGSSAPSSITPDVDGLVYYDTGSSACYQSSGGSWSPIVSHIKDRTVNELQTIVIDKIRVDEGGTDEDSQELRITDVSSSNATLVPVGNVKFVYGLAGDQDGTGDTNPDDCTTLGACHGGLLTGSNSIIFAPDTDASEDASTFAIHIVPVTGQTGTSKIEITFSDGTKTTEVEFNVTVQGNSATHGGWEAMAATGPKVDRNGNITEDRYHCPFSRDLCESGNECFSSVSTPVNNASADPDHFNAIYLFEYGSTQTCFRMKRTLLQSIYYVGKTSSYVDIAYSDGATAGAETIAVTGAGSVGDPYVITVGIDDGVSTTNQIITAIEADSTANGLVKAINTDSGEEQDAMSATSIGRLSNTNWEAFSTNCAISHEDTESVCSDEVCIGKGAPGTTPTVADARYYDEEGNTCYRSVHDGGSPKTYSWETYDATAEVKLTWNAFSVSGSGSITEYRVYRRLPNESYDYDAPINRTTIDGSSSTYSFVDNAKNSYNPPIPNTVYFYEVRPVVDGVVTATSDVFHEVRIVAPPSNMAFVHRWMANKTICDIMNRTPDPNNNYRCEYIGPGDITVSGTQYYDIEKDFLVDRFEAGCAYSAAPACPETSDGSCIGINDPETDQICGSTGAADGTCNGETYYARSTGKCWLMRGGNWTEFSSTTTIQNYLTTARNYNKSNLPPLTNISQEMAHEFCRDSDNDIAATSIFGLANDKSSKLPSRKEQIAFSQWDYSAISSSNKDSVILSLETGLSLNSQSKCNSSNASGISTSYSDVSVPSSADYFSLPGTYTSGIRSVVTGSSETASCVSLFGVQDAVGNVAEWTVDRLVCDSMSTCTVPNGADVEKLTDASDSDTISSDGTEAVLYDRWALDGLKGPCNDASGGDGVCDSNIGSWSIETEAFAAGRMFVPVGLVAHRDFLADNPTSVSDMLELGTVIDHDMLHDDVIRINSKYLYAGTNQCGGLAYGGGYAGDGTGAGVWAMEYIPCEADAYGAVTIQDITYKDLTGTPGVWNFIYASSTGAISVSTSGNDVTVNLGNSVTPTATVVAGAVNAALAGSIEAVVSGDATATQTPFSSAKYITDFSEEAKNTRPDVGFRCLVPITPGSDYDE